MDCRRARAVWASGAAPHRGGEGRAAQRHVAGCRRCHEHFAQLAAAVRSAEEEISCAECRAGLYRLIEAETAGGDGAAEPLLRRHLAQCPACRQAHRAAAAALLTLDRPGAPLPPSYPQLDLSFLAPPPARVAAWLALSALLGRGRRGRERWAGALAALLLLLLVAAGALALRRGGHRLGQPADDRRPPAPAVAPVTPPPTAPPTAVGRLRAPDLHRRAPTAAPPVPRPATVAVALAASPPGLSDAVAPPAPPALPSEAGGPSGATAPPGAGVGAEREERPTAVALPTPVMVRQCEISRPVLGDGILEGTCSVFPAAASYDRYTFSVGRRAWWSFSVCGRTQLDTILAVYRRGTFDPSHPCDNLIARDESGCGQQSRLTVKLDPGEYYLLVTEETGDVNGPYGLKVELEEGGEGTFCEAANAAPGGSEPSTPSPGAVPSATGGPPAGSPTP